MDRGFKGIWIPKEIWLSNKLTLQEKIFLVEIDSLDNEKGCFATNKHFSEFFGLSKPRCSEIIKSLENKGLITIDYLRDSDKKNIKKRIMKVVGISKGGIRKTEEGYSGNLKENNTSNNNTNNIKIYSLFDHWNSKNIIKHRKMNKQMESRINARLQEYSEDELRKAIDNYDFIISSDKYYWTHKWSLQDFMKPNNVTRFVDEANPLNNFKNSKQKEIVKSQYDIF